MPVMVAARHKLFTLVFVGVFVIVVIGGFTSSVSFAVNSTVRVGYPQPSGAMLPLWLVSDARLDQK